MRYSYTALALAFASATQVIASPERHAARHGHAAFHAKKDAGLPEVEKRDVNWAAALANVDWKDALASVDWSTVSITYSSDQKWEQATSSAAAAPPAATTTIAVASVPHTTSVAATTPSTTAAPTTTLVTSAVRVASTSAAAAVSTSSSSSGSDSVSSILSEVEELALKALGVVSAGINAVTGDQDVFIGTDGPYTMDINNNAGEDLYLCAWGPSGSWINSVTPLITLKIPSGGSTTLSFLNGASGALSAFYSDTELVDGQLSNTWIEFTMAEEGVFDISKEVNMGGHDVEVVGPSCTSNMSTCVFQCSDSSVTSCEYGYELVNCANGSQEGATFGTFDGADSGGCGGLGSSAAMTATFS